MHERLSGIHLLEAGMRAEEGGKRRDFQRLHLDAVDKTVWLSGSCHQALHHTTLTTT